VSAPRDDGTGDRFERILVVCTRQLGDVLLTTPLIRAARERWPAAVIDVLGFGGTLGMLRGNPDIGELIEVPAGSGWVASRRLFGRLWRATTSRWSRSTRIARTCTASPPQGAARGR